jgi:hypothetical protein
MTTWLPTARADGVEIGDLSLIPPHTCKKPPKAPPYRLMNKEFRAANTNTNDPFDHTYDINGDGWCDWISIAARPPHRTDLDEPEMQDFILLGNKNGWRKFGASRKHAYERGEASDTGSWLGPTARASSLIKPVFVYSTKRREPYVVALSLNNDILEPILEDVSAFNWDPNFDMLRGTAVAEKKVVIQYLRKTLCEPGNEYTGEISVQRAICGKQSFN